MHFYRARYYSPASERLIAQDPIGFRGGDANLYAYLLQDPVKDSDPYGLKSTTISIYDEVGAAVTYGVNPDGVSFLTIDIGVGIGGGIRMNPTGTSPGYSPKNGTSRNSCSVGSFAQVGAGVNGLNVFNFSAQSGTNYTPDGKQLYLQPPQLTGPTITIQSPQSTINLNGGISVGGRFGFTF